MSNDLKAKISSEALQINAKINTVTIQGKTIAGARGKSAYEIWLEQGNTGSIQDFLNAIGGDKKYTHLQIVPSEEWIIEHNLSKYPSVTIVDSAGTVVIGDVEYISTMILRVTFTSPFSGEAYLN